MELTDYRIVQAPMAGVSTPALTVATCKAGALGMLALAALTPDAAADAMAAVQAGTGRPFGVNLFCHQQAALDPAGDAAWCDRLAPHFARFGAVAPKVLRDLFPSFRVSDAMMRAVVAARPAMVSFHFGLPRSDQIAALREIGAVLAVTATSDAEARAARRAGIDVLIAQGWQAGGHRGMFDPDGPDEQLETLALIPVLSRTGLPVIAAGGMMTASDVRAAQDAGAVAAQCGTAFLLAPEAATAPGHRAAMARGDTVMTRAISGRPARALRNGFTQIPADGVAAYPRAYDAGKALIAAANAAADADFGAFWAGTGAAQAVARPAAETVAALSR